jgi:Flp pilus assembly protein TadG
MATLTNTRRNGETGQAIIELALTLPLLLIIVLGIFDFGFMFQRYEVVTNAAREGARVGVLPGYSVGDAQARAEQYLDAGGLAGTSTNHAADCAGGSLVNGQRCTYAVKSTATFGSPTKTVGIVTVTVSYDHEFTFVGPLMNLFGGSLATLRMKSVSTMRLEAN